MKNTNSQLTQMVSHITTLPVQYRISRYGQQNVIADLLPWHSKNTEINGISLIKNTGLIFLLLLKEMRYVVGCLNNFCAASVSLSVSTTDAYKSYAVKQLRMLGRGVCWK